MAGTTETINAASDTESTLRTVQTKVEGHDTLIKYLLAGIVGSIILLTLNLFQDRAMNDKLTTFATEAADSRMRMAANETSYAQDVITLRQSFDLFKQCLKLGGWTTCFQ